MKSSISRRSNSAEVPAKLAALKLALLTKLADEASETARASMGGPGPNPPSRPGEAPHRQTSELYNGVHPEVFEDQGFSQVTSERNGSSNVPRFLELGTRNMLPRPYMSPAYEQTLHDFRRIANEAAQETL